MHGCYGAKDFVASKWVQSSMDVYQTPGACRGDNCGHSIAGTPALSLGAPSLEKGRRCSKRSMVVSWFPENRWDRYHIIPPIWRKNATYIPLIVLANWVIIWYRSHLLREPGNSIEKMGGNFTFFQMFWGS